MKMFLPRIVTACALLLASVVPATAATITVTNTNDSGGGSLRAAIAGASPGDTIVFDAGLNGGTITLIGTEIAISNSVTIDATALPNGITVAGGSNGYSATYNLRPFQVNSGTFTLRGITMKSCGGAGSLSTLAGGAIRVSGSGRLDAYDCTFDQNRADKSGGALSCSSATGRLSLTRCTFSNNFTATDTGILGAGGAITCGGDLNVTNCTFFQNGTPTVTGGGVSAAAIYLIVSPGATTPPAMYLAHCTFSGNYAGSNGTAQQGCVVVDRNGAGFLVYCIMTNCIIAGTTNGGGTPVPDVRAVGGNNARLQYQGGNLVQSAVGFVNGGTITQTGNPLLAPLAFNGGPTKTMALFTGSPALNTSGNGGGGPTTDQRGFARIRDGNGSGTGAAALPDLGAYEAQVAPNSVGFNFAGGGGGPGASNLLASERAGVPAVAQGNWNNLTLNDDGTHTGSYTNGPAALKDANGATISPNLKLWWAAPNTYSINGTAQTTPNGKLMNGYLDSNGTVASDSNLYTSQNEPFFAVSGLPSSFAPGGYRVLVYADGGAVDGRIASYWLTGNDGQNPALVAYETQLTANVFARDASNFADGGAYFRATSTSDTGGTTTFGNYVQFDARTEGGFIVRAEESSGAQGRAPINAVQIVRNEIVVVTTLADELNPIGTLGAGVSLREALRDAPDGAGIIFDSSLSGGTSTLGSTLDISKNVTIDGSNLTGGLTLSGGNAVSLITVNSGYSVTLAGLTLANGYTDYDGGAIYNAGLLTLAQCTFTGNSCSGGSKSGGAVRNVNPGFTRATHCTFSGNTSGNTSGGAGGGGHFQQRRGDSEQLHRRREHH